MEPDFLRNTRASYDAVAVAYAEFRRVLVPGGYALLAFQVGHEPRHVTQALGQPVSVDLHQRQPDDVASMLARAGLMVRARLIREPDDEGDFTERTPQAFLLARKS